MQLHNLDATKLIQKSTESSQYVSILLLIIITSELLLQKGW
uniref:Uncharacterized protein n=1 Tax=Rhizophora mucronata TaxID=61149 RepID=A0A2P2J4V8_RHIMU